jgi:putative redox protein
MPNVRITLPRLGECRVEHVGSGAVVTTDLPPESGGEGESFSATDLLAAALGACIATSIDRVAERGGIPPEAIRVEVEKELSTAPKRVARLTVRILVERPADGLLQEKIIRAAHTCPVHRSLHPDVRVEIVIAAGGDSAKGALAPLPT